MRRNDDAAHPDRYRINPQIRPRARENEPDRRERAEGRDRMARRHAGIVGPPRKRLEGGRSLGGRPHPTDQAFHDAPDQRRKADRDKDEADPRREHAEHATGEPVEGRRGQRGEHDDQRADGNEHPARSPEIGDLVERRDHPERQCADDRADVGIDQRHGGDHQDRDSDAVPSILAEKPAVVGLPRRPARGPDKQRRPKREIVSDVASYHGRPVGRPLHCAAGEAHDSRPMKIVISIGRPVATLYPSIRGPRA